MKYQILFEISTHEYVTSFTTTFRNSVPEIIFLVIYLQITVFMGLVIRSKKVDKSHISPMNKL